MPVFNNELHLGHKDPLVETGDISDGAITGAKVASNAALKGGQLGVASTSHLGGIKPDGTTLTVDSDGTAHAVGGGGSGSTYQAGNGINIANNTISAKAHTAINVDSNGISVKYDYAALDLNLGNLTIKSSGVAKAHIASEAVDGTKVDKGAGLKTDSNNKLAVKPGHGINTDDGNVNINRDAYSLKHNANDELMVNIAQNGGITISETEGDTGLKLTKATTQYLGGIKVGGPFAVDANGVLTIRDATDNAEGVVKVDGRGLEMTGNQDKYIGIDCNADGGLEIKADGSLGIKASGVATSMINNSAVTAAKIDYSDGLKADANGKLTIKNGDGIIVDSGGISIDIQGTDFYFDDTSLAINDGAIDAIKLASGAVTLPKIASSLQKQIVTNFANITPSGIETGSLQQSDINAIVNAMVAGNIVSISTDNILVSYSKVSLADDGYASFMCNEYLYSFIFRYGSANKELVFSKKIKLGSLDSPVASAPTTTTSTGVMGQYYFSQAYLYICVDNNTWRRVALSTW